LRGERRREGDLDGEIPLALAPRTLAMIYFSLYRRYLSMIVIFQFGVAGMSE